MSHTLVAGSARVVIAVALPVLLIVAESSANPGRAERGLRYAFINKSTTTTADGATRERVMAAGTGAVLGSKARVDLSEAATNFVVKKGSYMLVNGESGLITIVDPSKRTYAELSVPELGQSIVAFASAASALVHMEVSGLETRGETVGAGPSISGFATTQYRVTQRYTLTISVFGKKNTITTSSTIDYFVAPSLAKDLVYPFTNLGITAGQMTPSGSALGEITRQIMDEQRKLFDGPPLRTLTRTESVDAKGKRTISIAANEITSIERAAVDPSVFELPTGFKATASPVAPLPSTGSGRETNATPSPVATEPRDSAGIATQVTDATKQGAADSAKSGTREGAHDAVAKKLRGMFRRP